MIPQKSPLLTSTQWEVLIEPNKEMSDADRRTHRSRARSRIQNIIRDFTYLFSNLSPADREKLFEDLDSYREHRERERDLAQDADINIDQIGEVDRSLRQNSSGRADPAMEGKALQEGITAMLAFLYAGVDDREEFSIMLEDAMRLNRKSQNLVPVHIDVSIEFGEGLRRGKWAEQWKSLSGEEQVEALRSHPEIAGEAEGIFRFILGVDDDEEDS